MAADSQAICSVAPLQPILELTTECSGWPHAHRVSTLPTSASPSSAMRIQVTVARGTSMTQTQMAVLVIAAIVVVAVVALLVLRRRSAKLRARFGSEYDRVVAEKGNRFKAEAQLENIEKRVKSYSLLPLGAADRDRFQQSWRKIQATFVDDPAGALSAADQLIGTVMLACGYPPSDFENRAAEISADHATVVDHYRAGHDIAVRHSQRQATTEDLRKAMLHYRALFDELVGEEQVPLRARAVGRA